MPTLLRLLAVFITAGALVLPLSASAFGISFGGWVVAAIPCVSPLGPSLFVTTAPAPDTFVTPLIWTPATVTYSVGPPVLPGQQVLGVADVPFSCTIGGVLPVFGLRMQIVGTSAPSPIPHV